MSRRSLLLAAGLLAGAAALSSVSPGGSGARAAAPNAQLRPNVVVLETDDQTVESLRVMANVKSLLAAEGTSFDNSFVSYALCCPSRATFLTGQYAHNHGVLGNEPPRGGYVKLDGTNTLPVWLQRAGYYTAHIGKYLNGYGTRNPREIPPGWSEWHGSVDPFTFRFYGYMLNENGTLFTAGSDPASYQTDVYAAKADELIRRRAASTQPFFLWTAFVAPHAGSPREPGDPPLATPAPAPRHQNRFASEALPTPPSLNEADVSDKPVGIRNRALLTSAQLAAIRESYQQRLESLLAVDEAVASIVRTLQETGELDETLIVFTSDNGFFHGEHRVPQGKVLLYEPSIRVPMILRGPGVPKGIRLAQPVANIDLAPTIVDAARAQPGRVLDGRSLLSLLRRPAVHWGRDLLFVRGPGGAQTFSAIRTPGYMYAEYGNGEKELYDLTRDPDELTSLHADPAHARLREELSRRLADLRTCSGARCRRGPLVGLALGYHVGRRGCVRSAVRVRVGGIDSAWVSRVDFLVDGRRVAQDDRAPFVRTVGRGRLDRGGSRVRAQVRFIDGRRVTLDHVVRRCG
jgi:N-acetylglucosamine-6-sulfatase